MKIKKTGKVENIKLNNKVWLCKSRVPESCCYKTVALEVFKIKSWEQILLIDVFCIKITTLPGFIFIVLFFLHMKIFVNLEKLIKLSLLR